MNKGKLIIVSGPSGAGKSTVIKPILAKYPDMFFSVSATTRDPRPGEVDGVDYHFISQDAFRKMIEEDALMEYNFYSGNYYGTPLPPVVQAMENGGAILDVDVNGKAQVVARYPEAITIFIAPPSFEAMEQRLRDRGTNTEADIQRRIKQAHVEVPHAHEYQFVVINDTKEAAIRDFESILLGLESAQQLRYEVNHDAVIFKEAN